MDHTQKHQAIIEDLKAGNQRFIEGKTSKSSELSIQKLKNFSKNGQFPKAILLCCSDSRAPVEIVLDQDIGDLFVIRVAGNIIAPSIVGSVEFAATTFGTSVVIVMGHSQCGVIRATIEHIENPHSIYSENIHDIVSRTKPHIFSITQFPDMPYEEKLSRSIEANVLASMSQLSHSSRLIETLVLEGKIEILGAVLELSTGKVEFLDI